MCNSISIMAQSQELIEQFQIENVLSYTTNRYEISPTQSVSAIFVRDHVRVLDEFRWGLVPFWGKDSVLADRDSIMEIRSLRRIIKKHRCVIPCSGFFVSQVVDKTINWTQFTMRSGTFGIAGIYEIWQPANGEALQSCSIIMTPANSLIAPYQKLMPAILDDDQIDGWLNPDLKEPHRALHMLRPMEELRMSSTMVASRNAKYKKDEARVPQPELA